MVLAGAFLACFLMLWALLILFIPYDSSADVLWFYCKTENANHTISIRDMLKFGVLRTAHHVDCGLFVQ
jgi:hypothetical protein